MSKKLTRLGCGVDTGKKEVFVCIGGLRPDGSYVTKARKKFKNTFSGIKQLIEWMNKHLAKLNPEGQLPFQMVMEPTGVYHELLLDRAYEAGFPVCLVLAQRVKYFLLSIGQISKTDAVDARGICKMACEVKQERWKPCSPNIMNLRSALRHRKSLVESKTRYKNQLHALKHSNYASSTEIESLERLVKVIEKEIRAIEKTIKKLYKQDKVLANRLQKIIDSLHGVGLITILTVVAETNGFAKISSRKQLTHFAGYDIVQDQSGQREGRTKISKQGNSRIRAVMHMSSLQVVQKEGPLQAMHSRILRKNPKVKMKAYVAVQRKLLLLIYTLYKKDEAYDPDYHKKLQDEMKGKQKGSPHSKSGLRGIGAEKVALPI